VKVSTRGDYASRALLSLALHGAQTTPTSVRDIAERTGLPQPYLEQILLALKGAGLVRSKRGVGGGYVLARDPAAITLAQIVSAVDGPIVAGDFGEPHTDGACDHEGQCVLLALWAEVGETIRTHLQSFTLDDMVVRARGGSPEPKARQVPGTAERPVLTSARVPTGPRPRAATINGSARPARSTAR
jgi:Rrf2 family iron-sulfur cluster assembly transcriptional regulator